MTHGTGLGNFLRTLRQDHGYTQERVSKLSGYSASYLSYIESGRRLPNPFALRCIIESMNPDPEKKDQAAALLLERPRKCS